jgi:hypothetical protein
MNITRTLTLAALLAPAGCGEPEVNRPPVAVAGDDMRVETVDGRAQINLNGAESFDPDGEAIEWRWSVIRAPSGLQIFGENRTASEPRLDVGATGLYIFELVVTDGVDVSAPDHVNVVVAPPAAPAD